MLPKDDLIVSRYHRDNNCYILNYVKLQSAVHYLSKYNSNDFCLIYEMLFIRKKRPCLNTQLD